MKTVVELEFAIGSKCVIREIGEKGLVYACHIGKSGIEYEVKWFSNCDRKSDWFRAEELEEAKP